jgi:hypothetical protein
MTFTIVPCDDLILYQLGIGKNTSSSTRDFGFDHIYQCVFRNSGCVRSMDFCIIISIFLYSKKCFQFLICRYAPFFQCVIPLFCCLTMVYFDSTFCLFLFFSERQHHFENVLVIKSYMITKFLCARWSSTVAKTAVLFGTTCFVPYGPAHWTLQS